MMVVLIIFPVILQTVINVIMLSTALRRWTKLAVINHSPQFMRM